MSSATVTTFPPSTFSASARAGFCLALIDAALHPERIRNLITCVTPVDFHADKQHERLDHGFMNVWVRNISPEEVDLMIDSFGNISGEVGGAFFSMMTPYRSLSKYCLTLVDVGQDREKLLNFLRMEKWLADRPDHTAASARSGSRISTKATRWSTASSRSAAVASTSKKSPCRS